MSYTNGIGLSQQFPAASEAVASPASTRAARTESGSLTVSTQNGATSAPHVDETTFSSAAGLLATALSGSDVRTEKVVALQQSIASGTYNVSSLDIASKMISALRN